MILALFSALLAVAQAFHGPAKDARDFPSSVYYQFDRQDIPKARCTAVVLDARTLLTAAHCLGDFEHLLPLMPWQWQCKLSKSSILIGAGASPLQRFSIASVHIHPAILKTTNPAPITQYKELPDLAVIKLNADLPNITKAQFAKRAPRSGDSVWLGGYGLVEEFKASTELRAALRPIAALNSTQLSILPAGRSLFTDHGDSGGPVYNENREVIGINSWRKANETIDIPIGGNSERYRHEVMSYDSYAARTDTELAWIKNAASGPAQSCPVPLR